MSMIMCSRISFPDRNIKLFSVNSVHIESSWKMLTDTAEIILPRKLADFDKKKIEELFVEGDRVVIELGYNGEYYTEFVGYINKVAKSIPLRILCEDEMYKLKRTNISFSGKNVKLGDLLAKVAPGYTLDTYGDTVIGKVRYSNVTAAQVLEDVQKKLGFYSYFTSDKVLHVGKVYGDQSGVKPVTIYLERNAVADELEYEKRDNDKIRVKAISITKGGKKIEVSVGDGGGSMKQLSYPGIVSKIELEKLARKDYERLKKERMSGNITLFGIPRVEHGMIVDFISELYADRAGRYYIDKVTKDFKDDATYRQVLEMGERAK